MFLRIYLIMRLNVSSHSYDGFQLDLQLQDETGGDISSFVTNGEWDLLGELLYV